MPWKVKKPTAADVSPDWLRPYCTPFLQKLADQGYAPATMRTYAGAMALFCQEIARRGLGPPTQIRGEYSHAGVTAGERRGEPWPT